MIAWDFHDEAALAGAPPDIRLLRVDIEGPMPLGAPPFDVLSAEERARAGRFRHPADALRFAAARAALRRALGQALGRPAAALRFAISERGRPFLEGGEIDFNLSHSGRHALVAWSPLRRVGVDIEAVGTGWDPAPLGPAVLGAEDARRLAAAGDEARAALFFDAWTAKEALLKADGRGIAADLASFSVLSADAKRPAVGGEGPVAEVLRGFDALWLRGLPGHAACLAWERVGDRFRASSEGAR